MINAVLRLRRDNDFNYAKIQDSFIPADGEICLVDTARDGLRAVCGDGVTAFGQLSYIDNFIEKGYLNSGKFYLDITLTKEIVGVTHKLYINLIANKIYHFNGENFEELSVISAASKEVAGIMKLYDVVGENTDGTMTQKAISDELAKKFEIQISSDEELVIFK